MPFPLLPLISFFSAFGSKKVPGFSQNVKELVTSKTNLFVSAPGITIGLNMLSNGDKIGHLYILIGLGLAFLRDTKFKTP